MTYPLSLYLSKHSSQSINVPYVAAHGKRSGGDVQSTYLVPRLGTVGLTDRQSRLTQYLLGQQRRQQEQQYVPYAIIIKLMTLVLNFQLRRATRTDGKCLHVYLIKPVRFSRTYCSSVYCLRL